MRKVSHAAAVTAMFALSAAANATVLPPESGEQPPDVFAGCQGCTMVNGFSGLFATATINGFTLTMRLAEATYSDPSNPFGAGKFDFMYQITNASSSTTAIGNTLETAFAPISPFMETDVGYTATGVTLPPGVFFDQMTGRPRFGNPFVDGVVAPGLVERPNFFGFDAVVHDFAVGPVDPGAASTVLIIKTNVTNVTRGEVDVFDVHGLAFFGIRSEVPAFGVAEPATLALFGFGLIGVGLSRRRLVH